MSPCPFSVFPWLALGDPCALLLSLSSCDLAESQRSQNLHTLAPVTETPPEWFLLHAICERLPRPLPQGRRELLSQIRGDVTLGVAWPGGSMAHNSALDGTHHPAREHAVPGEESWVGQILFIAQAGMAHQRGSWDLSG